MQHRPLKQLACILAAVAGATVLAGAPAHAQDIKAGLWEMTSKVQSAGGKMEQAMAMMQKQMATMTPEQRTMMEGMLAKQGMNVASMSGNSAVVKMCVTKEMAAQSQLPMQTMGSCTQTRGALVGNTMHVSVACTQPSANGEGVVTFSNSGAFTSSMRMSTLMAGKTESASIDSSGHWLGADCGSVQPPK
jgi:hypothetical protein